MVRRSGPPAPAEHALPRHTPQLPGSRFDIQTRAGADGRKVLRRRVVPMTSRVQCPLLERRVALWIVQVRRGKKCLSRKNCREPLSPSSHRVSSATDHPSHPDAHICIVPVVSRSVGLLSAMSPIGRCHWVSFTTVCDAKYTAPS